MSLNDFSGHYYNAVEISKLANQTAYPYGGLNYERSKHYEIYGGFTYKLWDITTLQKVRT